MICAKLASHQHGWDRRPGRQKLDTLQQRGFQLEFLRTRRRGESQVEGPTRGIKITALFVRLNPSM